jgi:hypothetical protein
MVKTNPNDPFQSDKRIDKGPPTPLITNSITNSNTFNSFPVAGNMNAQLAG